MPRILAAITVLIFLLPISGRAQEEVAVPLPKADQIAIRDVIAAQLSALRQDDGVLAFSYASPMIRARFGAAENFLAMVQVAYPAVHHPRDVQFRELEYTYDGPMQKVFFFGPDGEAVLGLFYMQQQEDGGWKVNGCELAPAPDIGI